MAASPSGYLAAMPSVKTRLAFALGKHLVTHPRSRLTRFVLRFAAWLLVKKVVASTPVGAVPATRGSRLTTIAGVAAVAGAITFVARRTIRARSDASGTDLTPAPFASGAGAPPETRDAPPTTPTADLAAEAAAADGGESDDALVRRVSAELFGGTPPVGVTLAANAGVVTLRGTVADEAAEGALVRDAEAIAGVKAVQSELQTAGAEPGPAAS